MKLFVEKFMVHQKLQCWLRYQVYNQIESIEITLMMKHVYDQSTSVMSLKADKWIFINNFTHLWSHTTFRISNPSLVTYTRKGRFKVGKIQRNATRITNKLKNISYQDLKTFGLTILDELRRRGDLIKIRL